MLTSSHSPPSPSLLTTFGPSRSLAFFAAHPRLPLAPWLFRAAGLSYPGRPSCWLELQVELFSPKSRVVFREMTGLALRRAIYPWVLFIFILRLQYRNPPYIDRKAHDDQKKQRDQPNDRCRSIKQQASRGGIRPCSAGEVESREGDVGFRP